MIVLTHLDSKKDDRAMIEEDVSRQFDDIFGIKPRIISVSSTRYQKGMMENKNLLVKKSGYHELLSALGNKLQETQGNRKEKYLGKIEAKVNDVLAFLDDKQKEIRARLDAIREKDKEIIAEFKKKQDRANETIKRAWQIYLESIKTPDFDKSEA